MVWKPISDPPLARRSREAVDAIAEALLAEVEQLEDPSLGVGLSGPALFFSYLDRARPSPRFSEAGVVCLERAMEMVTSGRWPPSLFDGFSGVAWTLEHLRPWLVREGEDPLREIDEALVGYLGSLKRWQPVELMYGLAGLGVYLLERLPRPSAREGLRRLVARLEETAEREGALCSWHSDAKRPGPRPEGAGSRIYHLGVAHGVPGVLGFLARLFHAGIEPERTRRLAEGAFRWLLRQRLPAGGDCRFPTTVGAGTEPVPARTAWCSGDLGIAAVLLSAARGFGRRDWEEQALEWARLAARRSPELTGVTDPSLCHGAAGLGYLFLRLHRATGDSVTGAAARLWLERALAMRQPGEGLAGFLSRSGDGRGRDVWLGEPGLLLGVAGIGLTLLAAVTDVEPRWDRVLLTFIPEAG